MATSFQLYIDKENTAVPLKHTGSGQPLGVRGVGLTPNIKTFAGKESSLVRSGPRSALHDVNSIVPQPPLKNKQLKDHVAPAQQLFKKPAPKDNDYTFQRKSDKHQKSKINPTVGSKHRVINKAPEPLPEIENMYIFNEKDMEPRTDPDFIGVLGKIRRWKPPCFFGGQQDSDSEEEVIDDLVDLAAPLPQFDMGTVELEEVDVDIDIDISIPHIDKDLPIPFLDDSIDIEPNLGTLEIYDSSTPIKRSPCVKL